jgi:MFS family permease
MSIQDNVFRSLHLKNYRLFFTGQIISVTGSWLQMTAIPWVVYAITGSAALLGLVAFLDQIFLLILSPFAGTVADKFPRRKILIITQTCFMILASTLAVLRLSGNIQVWHIFIIATLLGIINAFDMTTRQAFVVDLVPTENLVNAVGLNSLIFNSARVIGPSVAGIIIAHLGDGYCFLINAISYIFVIYALWLIKPLKHTVEEGMGFKEKFTAGIEFIKTHKTVRNLLLLVAAVMLMTVFPIVLMPVFAKDVYALGARGLGLFMSAIGVGALLATITIASKTDIENIKKQITYASLFIGVGVMCFSTIINVYGACVFLAVTGYCMVLTTGLTNTYIQLTAPLANRGTVMGFFIMAFAGFMPIGSLIAGQLAHIIGAKITCFAAGVLVLIAAIFLRRKILTSVDTAQGA